MDTRETVALIGAHGMGKMYLRNTGYRGPWADDVHTFTNGLYTELLE